MLRKPNHDRRPMKVETLENRVLPSGFALGAGGLTCTPPVMANPYMTAPALTASAGPQGPRLYTPCLTAGDVTGPAAPAALEGTFLVRAAAAAPVAAPAAAPVAAPAVTPTAAPAAAPVAAPAVAAQTQQSLNAGHLTVPAGTFTGRPSATDSTVVGPATSVSTTTDVTVSKLRDSSVENLKAVDMQIFPAAVNAVMAQVGAQSLNAVVGLACVGPFATTP